jgi:hypothetical protein
MEKWFEKKDCEIVRPDSQWDVRVPGHAVLMDTEGARIFVVPETFTDDQIWECLRIANVAYAEGDRNGKYAKAREIARALFID